MTGPDGNVWFTESDANILGRLSPAKPQASVTSFTLPTSGSTPVGSRRRPRSCDLVHRVHGRQGRHASAGSPVGGVVTTDPTQTQYNAFANSMIGPLDGNLQTSIALDPAPGCNCGLDTSSVLSSNLSLTYNSDTVRRPPDHPDDLPDRDQWTAPHPDPGHAHLERHGPVAGHLPDDRPQPGRHLSPQRPGANPVTATGAYPWKVDIQATLPDGNVVDTTTSGMAFEVVNGSTDPLGRGWSLGGTAQLFPDGSGGYFWVDGNGGTRDFQAGNGTTFVSPANDFGTLVKNSNGTFTYTDPQMSAAGTSTARVI